MRKFKHLAFLLIFLLGGCVLTHPKATPPRFSPSEKDHPSYAHFLQAEFARYRGDHAEALREYRLALKSDPSPLYLRRTLVSALLREKKIHSAKLLLKETLHRYPAQADLLFLLANIYLQERENEEAIHTLKNALQVKPDDVEMHRLLFHVLLQDKRWEEARNKADELIQLTNGSAEMYFLIGVEFGRAHAYSQGIEYLQKATALSPHSAKFHLGLGALYEGTKDFPRAAEEYETALSLSPFSSLTYYRLGEIYTNLQKIEKAISVYRTLLQMDSSDAIAATALGQLYYRKSDYGQARDTLVACPEKNFQIYYLLGACLLQLKEEEKAKESLQESIRLNPHFIPSYSLLAHLYSAEGKKEESISLLQSALEQNPQNKQEIYLLLGTTYSHFKSYPQSIHTLRKAVELDSHSDEAHFQLGAAYERSHNWFKSVYHLRKTLKLNPRNSAALNYLGYMFAEKGVHLQEAEELIEKALEIEPANGYYVDSLAWVHFKKGRLEEALKTLLNAIVLLEEQGVDDPVIREHLGDVYYRQGNLQEAQRQWQKSLSLDPEREEVKAKIENLEKEMKQQEKDETTRIH